MQLEQEEESKLSLLDAALFCRCCLVCWVFTAVLAFSSCGDGVYASLQGPSYCGAQDLGPRASVVALASPRALGSVAAAPGLSHSSVCAVFPDQGSN